MYYSFISEIINIHSENKVNMDKDKEKKEKLGTLRTIPFRFSNLPTLLPGSQFVVTDRSIPTGNVNPLWFMPL